MRLTPTRSWTAAATLVVAAAGVMGLLTLRLDLAVVAGLGVVCVALGWVIQIRVPESPVGPALAWCSASVALVGMVDAVAAGAFGEPAAAVTRPFGDAIWPVNLVGFLALLLVFPDGRDTGRLARSAPGIFAAAACLVAYGLWGGDEPTGVRLAATLAGLGLVGVSMILAALSLVARYRSGTDERREQIRWLMLAGALVVVLLVAGWGAEAVGATLNQAYSPFLAGIVVLVPAAVGIAIVRHDLFDIDRLVSEGTAWTASAVVAAAAYGAVVAAFGTLAHRFAAVGPAVGGFAAALALLPTHRLLRDATARVFDRDRFVALRTVEAFSDAVRSGERQPEQIQDVLREAQRDDALRVLLVDGDSWVDLDGRPVTEEDGTISISSGGEVVARLVLGRDSKRARRRAASLARAAWIPIEVSRLRLGLRRSQARIAQAAAQERKRLERDLHDTAQQRILATGMRLRALQPGLDPERSGEIDVAVAELRDVVVELRRLAHGVRPSRLDDGLGAALEDIRALCPLPIDLVVAPLPEVDDSRTLAAYAVVTEAVANALKHARASRISVRVGSEQGRLRVTIADDGIGGVPTNVSLFGLRDRVLSVGGELSIESPAGVGTEISAVL